MNYTRLPDKIITWGILGAVLLSVFFLADREVRSISRQIVNTNQTLAVLQQQFTQLQNRVEEVSKEKSVVKESIIKEETVRREVVREKSQEELLTAAVAKIVPSVVSVIVSKEVPQLEVVYVNPFGDDPFFKDFGVRVPMYRQNGTQIQKVGAATGFLINNDGYILTNRHVAEDTTAQYTVLLSNGTQQNAQVVYKDPDIDMAILKIGGSGYASVQFGDSGILKIGQSVFAVGNALGEYNNSVSVGIVSGLNRDIQASGSSGTQQLSGVIQTDAAINPGNSGGPLVDLQGQVIGMNVATVVGSQNISFSIPINSVKKIIQSVLK